MGVPSTVKASQARLSLVGDDVVDGVGDVRGGVAELAAGRTATIPIWESIGQLVSASATASHCGVACGLPITPVGKSWISCFGVLQRQSGFSGWLARCPACIR